MVLFKQVGFVGPLKKSSSGNAGEEVWKEQMKRDNDRKIEAMSEGERERHVAEILEQLGPNVGELLHKAREARTRTEANSGASAHTLYLL